MSSARPLVRCQCADANRRCTAREIVTRVVSLSRPTLSYAMSVLGVGAERHWHGRRSAWQVSDDGGQGVTRPDFHGSGRTWSAHEARGAASGCVADEIGKILLANLVERRCTA